jgi:hypothetical protein
MRTPGGGAIQQCGRGRSGADAVATVQQITVTAERRVQDIQKALIAMFRARAPTRPVIITTGNSTVRSRA